MVSVRLSPELKALHGGLPQAAPAAIATVDVAGPDAPTKRYVLRRSGMRPLAFTGMLLLSQGTDSGNDLERRHVIRIYETTDQTLIVEISLSAANGDGVAHALAVEVGSLCEVEDFLNAYDPAAQAALALTVDDSRIDAFAVGVMADCLRTDAERLRRDFQLAREALFAPGPHQDHATSQKGQLTCPLH